MLEVTDIKVHTFDLDWLDVYWKIKDTYDDVDSFSIYVLKSEAEQGPYHVIAGPFEDKYHFRDTTARQLRRYREWYYRIRLVDKRTDEAKEFPSVGGASMMARLDLEGLEMARQEEMRLREFNGRKVLLYPLRTFGQICKCIDPATDQKLYEPCTTCYGTRYVGGYHTPVMVWARIVSPSVVTRKSVFAEIKTQSARIELGNFPIIQTGWLVIEPMENVRWTIGEVFQGGSEKLRSPVTQGAPLTSCPIGDVAYKVPVLIDDPQNFEASPARQFSRPHSLDSLDDSVYVDAIRALT